VRVEAGDNARKRVFGDELRVDGGVGEQGRQRELGELMEFMIADGAQQSRPLFWVHHPPQLLHHLIDEWMFIGVHHAVLADIEDPYRIQGVGGAAQAPQRAVDLFGTVLLAHPGEIDLDQLRPQSHRLEIQRQGLTDFDDLRQPGQRVEVNRKLKARSIPRLGQEFFRFCGVVPI
jgi:hypothetical protein